MGTSASSPRPEQSTSRSKGDGVIVDRAAVVSAASSSASTSSSTSTSGDDDNGSGDVGVAGVADALARYSEPAPLEHPSPEALARMCAAVATLIQGLGEDIGREGLFDTPKVRAIFFFDA